MDNNFDVMCFWEGRGMGEAWAGHRMAERQFVQTLNTNKNTGRNEKTVQLINISCQS